MEQKVTVKVDQAKIQYSGKRALGDMLTRLHVYRCTANVAACRPYYEELTSVDSEHERWRAAVLAQPEPRRKFVQCNTFIKGRDVILKEYDSTNEGLIQSWAERDV